MIKVRNFAAVMAISALAALPGCSLFQHEEQPAAATPPPAPAAAPAPAPAPPPASNPEQNALSHSLVRKVQMELKRDHLYRGHVDGVWGPMTKRGVTRFQQKNNLPVTGELDDATLQAMNLSAGPMGGPPEGGGMEGGASPEAAPPAAPPPPGAPPSAGAPPAGGGAPAAGAPPADDEAQPAPAH